MRALLPWLVQLIFFVVVFVPARLGLGKISFLLTRELFGMSLDRLIAFTVAYLAARYARKIFELRLMPMRTKA